MKTADAVNQRLKKCPKAWDEKIAFVFFQTAFVFACSYKGSAKNRLVATSNRLLISLFGVKVAHVARFFEFLTRARKKMPAALRRISVDEA